MLAVESGKIPAPHIILKTSPFGAVSVVNEINFFDKYQLIWRVEEMSIPAVENLILAREGIQRGFECDRRRARPAPAVPQELKYLSQPLVELVKVLETKPEPIKRSAFKIPMLAKASKPVAVEEGELVADGQRMAYLKGVAIKLRKEGLSEETIEEMLYRFRDERCEPGMSNRKLPTELAKWVANLSPEQLRKEWWQQRGKIEPEPGPKLKALLPLPALLPSKDAKRAKDANYSLTAVFRREHRAHFR